MRALLTALLLLVPTVAAQDSSPGPSRGDLGMLFSFGGLSTGSYNGGVGVKWWSGETTAVTAGVQLSASGEEREESATRNGFEFSQTSAGVDVGVEFHTAAARFSPFVSLDLGAGLRNSTSKNFQGDNGLVDEARQERVYIEGGVGVGAEYWLAPRFSVAARQRLRASYETGTTTDIRPQSGIDEERDVSGYNVGLGGTSLTLSVYF